MTNEEIKKITLDACPGCDGMIRKGVRVSDDGTLESCQCARDFTRYSLYSDADVEAEYWKMTLEDFDEAFLKTNQQSLLPIRFFLENLQTCTVNNVQIVLYGRNGLGKTVTAYQILMRLLDAGLSGKYFTAPNLAELTFKDPAGVLEELLSRDFIIVDELDKFSGRNQEALMRLSNLLCETMRHCSVVFITNQPAEELKLLGYSNSFLSRLSALDWLEFKGTNLRRSNQTKLTELMGTIGTTETVKKQPTSTSKERKVKKQKP